MIALAFVLSILAAFFAGYKYERLLVSIKSLRDALDKKQDVKEVTHTSNTSDSIIDPLDIVQRARFEHDEMLRRLNTDE